MNQIAFSWTKHPDGRVRTMTFNAPEGKDLHLYYGIAGVNNHTLTLTHEMAIELLAFLQNNLEAPVFERKCGDEVCQTCNKTWYKHPKHPLYPWLVVACSKNLYKL